MREIWVIDAETDPFKKGRIPAPFIWGVYNGHEYFEFTDTKKMIIFLMSKDIIVYAHNGGKFDYFFLLDYIAAFSNIMIINGRLSKFKIGECEFRDSINILPIALAQYQKDTIDYAIFEKSERDKPENKRIISEYLNSDCVYLHKLVTAFVNEYGLNITLASTAMKTWAKIADTEPPKTTPDFYRMISPFYYGGRVECFESGILKDGPFKIVDINSAYPFAMIHNHPYGTDCEELDTLPTEYEAIQRSFIDLMAQSTGAFPYREKDGTLNFPNDNIVRNFKITGWEYLAAKETGKLRRSKILSCIVFPETIEFKKYIDHFFNMKAEAKANGDKEKYIFAKIFMNGLYGKFSACPENYNEFKVIDPKYIDASAQDGYEFSSELGKWALIQRPLSEEKQRYYNVAVGASVTGFVRAYLFRNMQKVKGLIYCDTDSIVCRDICDIEVGGELGKWALEATASSGAVAGKKLYAFKIGKGKYKTATKGTKLNYKQIIEVAKGKEIVYEPENPSFSIHNGISFVNRKVRKTAKVRA